MRCLKLFSKYKFLIHHYRSLLTYYVLSRLREMSGRPLAPVAQYSVERERERECVPRAVSLISVLTQWGATLVIKIRERERITPPRHRRPWRRPRRERCRRRRRQLRERKPPRPGRERGRLAYHGAAKKAGRCRSASQQRSSGARGQSRPLCPLTPTRGLEPETPRARSRRLRHQSTRP